MSEQRTAREEALNTLAGELVSLAVWAGLVIGLRYHRELAAAGQRILARARSTDAAEGDRELQVAAFRAAVSRWEHAHEA